MAVVGEGRLGALTNGGGRGAALERGSKKRKLKLFRKRRAAIKIQGQYIGCLRKLKPRQKVQVKAVRAKKGFPAAIDGVMNATLS